MPISLAKLSFVYRLLLAFGVLLVVLIAVLLLQTSRWMDRRIEEEVAAGLKRKAEVLKRIHASASWSRSLRLETLAVEPRLRALTEVGDRETLEFAAQELQQELRCASFAFVSSRGELLAWAGLGQPELFT